MTDLTLQATARNVLGKKTRFLRRQGITPAHLFGHGIESLPLQCDTASLQRIIARAGTTRLVTLEIEGRKQPTKVFIREIQSDACTGALIHVDLYQVRLKERMKADVPLVLSGEAPALKSKGRSLIYGVTSLSMVGNKIRGQKDEDFLRKHLPDFDFLGFIPYDGDLIEADLEGISPYDTEAQSKKEVGDMIEKLMN